MSEEVYKKGYLTKQGGGHKSWRRRLFVLRGLEVLYYKPNDETKPKGSFTFAPDAKIEVADSATKKKNSFCVHTPQRIWYMFAENELERTEWMKAFKFAQDRFKEKAEAVKLREKLKEYSEKLRDSFGKLIPIEVAWDSLGTEVNERLNLARKIIEDHVPNNLLKLLEELSKSSFDKQSVTSAVQKIVVKCSPEESKTTADATSSTLPKTASSVAEKTNVNSAGVLTDIYPWNGTDVKEKLFESIRAQNPSLKIIEKTLKTTEDDIAKLTGKKITVTVDMNSLSTAPDKISAIRTVSGEAIVGKLVNVFQEICSEEDTKSAIAGGLHKILIEYNSSKKVAEFKDSIFYVRFSLSGSEVKQATVAELKDVLEDSFNLDAKKLNKVAKEAVTPFEKEIKELLGKKVSINVDWPSLKNYEDESDALECVTSDAVLGEVLKGIRKVCSEELALQIVKENFNEINVILEKFISASEAKAYDPTLLSATGPSAPSKSTVTGPTAEVSSLTAENLAKLETERQRNGSSYARDKNFVAGAPQTPQTPQTPQGAQAASKSKSRADSQFTSKTASVVVGYRMKLDSEFKDGVLNVKFAIDHENAVHMNTAEELKGIMYKELRIEERMKEKEVKERQFPIFRGHVRSMLNDERFAVEIDWDTIRGSMDYKKAVEALRTGTVLARVSQALEDLCSNTFVAKLLAQNLKGVKVLHREEDTASPQTTSVDEKGWLNCVYEVGPHLEQRVAFSTAEEIRRIISKSLHIEEKKAELELKEKILPAYSSMLSKLLNAEITVSIDWDSIAIAHDKYVVLKAIGGEFVLGKIGAAFEDLCREPYYAQVLGEEITEIEIVHRCTGGTYSTPQETAFIGSKLIEVFYVNSEYEQVVDAVTKKALKKILNDHFNLSKKKMMQDAGEIIKTYYEKVKGIVGKELDIVVDWDSFVEVPDVELSADIIGSDYLLKKIASVLEDLCHDDYTKSIIAEMLNAIHIYHRHAIPDSHDKTYIVDGILHDVIEMNAKFSEGLDYCPPEELKRIIIDAFAIDEKRMIRDIKIRVVPHLEEKVSRLLTKQMNVNVNYDTIFTAPFKLRALRVLQGEQVVERVISVLEELCEDSYVKKLISEGIEEISILHRKPGSTLAHKTGMEGTTLHLVYEVDSVDERQPADFPSFEGLKEILDMAFQLTIKKLTKHIQEVAVVACEDRIARVMKKKRIPVHIDWGSVNSAPDVGMALKAIMGSFVLEKLALVFEEICSTDLGRELVTAGIDEVWVYHRSGNIPTIPDATQVADGKLFDVFKVNKFDQTVDYASKEEVLRILNLAFEIEKKQLNKDVEEVILPMYGEKVSKIVGKVVVVDVAWQSLRDSVQVLHALHGEDILGEVSKAIEKLCMDEFAKMVLQDNLKKVTVLHTCAHPELPSEMVFRENTLFIVFEVLTTVEHKIEGVKDSRIIEYLTSTLDIDRKRYIHQIKDMKIPNAEEKLLKMFGKKLHISVDLNSILEESSDVLSSLAVLAGTSMIDKVVSVLEQMCGNDEFNTTVVGEGLDTISFAYHPTSKGPPVCKINEGVLTDEFQLVLSGNKNVSKCSTGEDIKRLLITTFKIEEKKLRKHLAEGLLPVAKERITELVGKEIPIEISWMTGLDNVDEAEFLKAASSDTVLNRIVKAFEEVCVDNVSKKAVSEGLDSIRLCHKSERSYNPKETVIKDRILYEVFELDPKFTNGINVRTLEELKSLLLNHLDIPRKRAEKYVRDAAVPAFIERIQKAMSKTLKVEVMYETMKYARDQRLAYDKIGTESILGKVLNVISELCKDRFHKEILANEMKGIIVKHNNPDRPEKSRFEEGVYYEVFEVNLKFSSGVDCLSPEDLKNLFISSFDLSARSAMRESKSLVPAFSEKISKVLEKNIPIIIDWESFEKSKHRDVAYKAICGEHVLQKIYKVLEEGCNDETYKKIVSSCIDRIRIQYKENSLESGLRSDIVDGVLTEQFEVNEIFDGWMHSTAYNDVKAMIERCCNLKEKIAESDVRNIVLPSMTKRIMSIVGREIPIGIDWDTFKGIDNQVEAYTTIGSDYVLGKICKVLEKECKDTVGKDAVGNGLLRILVRYHIPKNVTEEEHVTRSFIKDGVLVEVFSCDKQFDINTSFTSYEDLRRLIVDAFSLPVLRTIRQLKDKVIPQYREHIIKHCKREIPIAVDWESFKKAPNEVEALKKIDSEICLLKITEVLCEEMKDEIGQEVLGSNIKRILICYKYDGSREKTQVKMDGTLVDVFNFSAVYSGDLEYVQAKDFQKLLVNHFQLDLRRLVADTKKSIQNDYIPKLTSLVGDVVSIIVDWDSFETSKNPIVSVQQICKDSILGRIIRVFSEVCDDEEIKSIVSSGVKKIVIKYQEDLEHNLPKAEFLLTTLIMKVEVNQKFYHKVDGPTSEELVELIDNQFKLKEKKSVKNILNVVVPSYESEIKSLLSAAGVGQKKKKKIPIEIDWDSFHDSEDFLQCLRTLEAQGGEYVFGALYEAFDKVLKDEKTKPVLLYAVEKISIRCTPSGSVRAMGMGSSVEEIEAAMREMGVDAPDMLGMDATISTRSLRKSCNLEDGVLDVVGAYEIGEDGCMSAGDIFNFFEMMSKKKDLTSRLEQRHKENEMKAQRERERVEKREKDEAERKKREADERARREREAKEEEEKKKKEVEERRKSLLERVKKGDFFVKHGRKGNPHRRFVNVTSNLDRVQWGENSSKITNFVPFSEITSVVEGQKTEVFHRKGKPDRVKYSFSLIGGSRTLDLEAETVEVKDEWVAALKAVIEERKEKSSSST